MFTRYLGYTDLPVKKSWHIYRVSLAEIRWNTAEAASPVAAYCTYVDLGQ